MLHLSSARRPRVFLRAGGSSIAALLLAPCLALFLAAGCSSMETPPTDGASSGGAGGSATGAGGAGGGVCESLQASYAEAFAAARSCSPQLANIQCTLTASPSLACNFCQLHVNSTTVLDQLRTAYDAVPCPALPCPAIACVPIGPGACVANDGGATGSCN